MSWKSVMNDPESSFDGYRLELVFFSNSEKSLFGFLDEIYDYDEEAFISSLVVSLGILLDIHNEYIERDKFLTQTEFASKKENLITVLDDSRWDSFEYDFKEWMINLTFSKYAFDVINQIKTIGDYRNYREVLISAMRLLYVLSVQKANHIPVNSFRKIHKSEIPSCGKSVKFIYHDITGEIKGLFTLQ